MTLSANTLATELKALSLYDTEAAAITAWAGAFGTYFQGAQSNAVVIVSGSIAVAETAMIGAATGLATGAGTALQAGITAFWGALVPAIAWPTTTVITPPGLLAGMGAALDAVFASNMAGALDKNTCMTNIANIIHANVQGGTATWPLPIGPAVIT